MYYIVIDQDGYSGEGKTVDEAWKCYSEECGNESISNCKFYEAKEIKVEVVVKTVVTNVSTLRKSANKVLAKKGAAK